MSTLKVDEILDSSGGSNAVLYGPASPAGSMGFRNRIINGDMRIDQRGAVASTDGAYVVDRFAVRDNLTSGTFTAQQSTTAPTGFNNSLLFTTGTAGTAGASQQARFTQAIEGNNIADLGWGSASAKTITVSFWVRSSLTGTFAGGLRNNNADRSYVFNYTVSSANTFEYKTVTIAGDTSGTWETGTSQGINLIFDLGSGSNFQTTAGSWSAGNYFRTSGAVSIATNAGATFYITGVQLEVGSVATEFERRPYGTELILCQRYYWLLVSGDAKYFTNAWQFDSTSMYAVVQFPVTMRSAPTLASNSGSNYYIFYRGGSSDPFDSFTLGFATNQSCSISNTSQISGTGGQGGGILSNGASAYVAFSAEL